LVASLLQEEIVKASRYFVKEGPMKICNLDSKKRKAFKTYYFFLFNDILMWAKKSVCI
jgi:hypothetical protein